MGPANFSGPGINHDDLPTTVIAGIVSIRGGDHSDFANGDGGVVSMHKGGFISQLSRCQAIGAGVIAVGLFLLQLLAPDQSAIDQVEEVQHVSMLQNQIVPDHITFIKAGRAGLNG